MYLLSDFCHDKAPRVAQREQPGTTRGTPQPQKFWGAFSRVDSTEDSSESSTSEFGAAFSSGVAEEVSKASEDVPRFVLAGSTSSTEEVEPLDPYKSSGRTRSAHGTQSGAMSASSPGSRPISQTVATFERGARERVANQNQPR